MYALKSSGRRDSTSASMLDLPGRYLMLKLKSASSATHRCPTAVFFLLLGIDFLALMFLLIYVGAIAILFLFVIMLLNLTDYPPVLKREVDMTNYIPIGFIIGIFFFSEIASSGLFLGSFQIEN